MSSFYCTAAADIHNLTRTLLMLEIIIRRIVIKFLSALFWFQHASTMGHIFVECDEEDNEKYNKSMLFSFIIGEQWFYCLPAFRCEVNATAEKVQHIFGGFLGLATCLA